jgi:2-dehydropantoate 2-reductase
MYEVAVLGAGAIGSAIGAALAETGRDVLLVGRESHVEAIERDGLALRDVTRDETVTVALDASTELEPAETVFLGMKTPDVPAGIEQIEETAPGATVVTLQNGVRADDMAAAELGRAQVVGGVVILAAEFLDPGRVTITRPEPVLFGNPWGGVTDQAEHVAGLFERNRRIPIHLHDDLRGARWTKLILNLNNAVPAVTGDTLQETYRDDALARIATRSLWEGVRTVRAADRPIAALPDVPTVFLLAIAHVPHRLGWRVLRSQVLDKLGEAPARPSTLQSVLRGGAGEIDYLNGEVVSLGRATGRPTPVNSALVEMVHEVERTGEFLDRETVLERIE